MDGLTGGTGNGLYHRSYSQQEITRWAGGPQPRELARGLAHAGFAGMLAGVVTLTQSCSSLFAQGDLYIVPILLLTWLGCVALQEE